VYVLTDSDSDSSSDLTEWLNSIGVTDSDVADKVCSSRLEFHCDAGLMGVENVQVAGSTFKIKFKSAL